MKRRNFMAALVCLAMLAGVGASAGADFTPADAARLVSATLVWQPKSDEAKLQGPAITATIEDDRLTKAAKLISEAEEMETGAVCSFYGEAMLPGLPAPEDMQAEEALALARTELVKSPLVTPEQKARLKSDMNFIFYEQPYDHGNTWHIMFRDPESEYLEVIYSVTIDAAGGRVLESIGPGERNG